MSAKKVAVLIPSRGETKVEFVGALAQFLIRTTSQLGPDDSLGILIGENSYIHRNRNDLLAGALLDGATHLLWLDDDMTFPSDALWRLMKHDVAMVGVNYPKKDVAAEPTAILHTGVKSGQRIPELLYTEPEDTGLASVDAVGFGLVLMKAEVPLALKGPCFENYFDALNDRWVGEDVDFCNKVKAAGFNIYVDHDLSKDVTHVGKFAYTCDHMAAMHGLAVEQRKAMIEHGA